MKAVKNYKFWFCTGSQDLYGDTCLEHVAQHSKIIVEELNNQKQYFLKYYLELENKQKL